MERSTVKANKFGLMAHVTMVCGRMIKLMVKEFLYMQMVMFTKVVGLTIKHMDKVHINMQMEQLTLVIGLKTNSMVRALKPGQMVLATTAVIKMAKRMETEF